MHCYTLIMVFAEKTHKGYIKYMNVKVYSNYTLVCGHITDTTLSHMFLTIALYGIKVFH